MSDDKVNIRDPFLFKKVAVNDVFIVGNDCIKCRNVLRFGAIDFVKIL